MLPNMFLVVPENCVLVQWNESAFIPYVVSGKGQTTLRAVQEILFILIFLEELSVFCVLQKQQVSEYMRSDWYDKYSVVLF